MSEQQTTVVAPVPGSAEADAAAAAKFDQAQAAPAGGEVTPPAKTERPAHVPEKFWDAEKGEIRVDELAKSYTALESGKTKKDGEQDPPAGTSTDNATKSAAALAEVGLDYSKFVDNYLANGKLSDADYAAMEAKNIPRAVVDAHIETQVALAKREADDIRTDVFSVAGGEEGYGKMTAWMAANMSKAELVAYNSTMDSQDIGQIKLAVQGVFSKFSATQGSDPKLVEGNRSETQGDVYESTQQLTADMKKPEYQKDPAFRAKVQAKLSRSKIM